MKNRDDDISGRALFGLSTIVGAGAIGVGLHKGIKQAWPEAKPILESMGLRSKSDLVNFIKSQAESVLPRNIHPPTVAIPHSSVLDTGIRDIDPMLPTKSLNELRRLEKFAVGPLGIEGWKVLVAKSIQDSLYNTGVVGADEIANIMKTIESTPPHKMVSVVKDLGAKIGDARTVARNIRVNLGAAGVRTPLTDVVSDLADKFLPSDFVSGGKYWDSISHIPVEGTLPKLVPLHKFWEPLSVEYNTSIHQHAARLEAALQSMGVKNARVIAGTREMVEGRLSGQFFAGQGYETWRMTPDGNMMMPLAELRVSVGDEVAHISLPFATRGYTTYGIGKMGVATVPSFTIPEGSGKVRTATWNQAIAESLYGQGEFDNLAAQIYAQHKEGKALNAITKQYEARMRARLREVPLGSGPLTSSVTLGRIHQSTIYPLEKTLAGVGAESSEEIIEYRKALEVAGIKGYPLTSPNALVESMGMVTKPLHEEWDVFGDLYPYERRPLQSVRPFGPTQQALDAMKTNKLLGIFPRMESPSAMKDVLRSPMVLTAYMIPEAQSLRDEELLVAKGLADVTETRTLKSYTLRSSAGVPPIGTVIPPKTKLGIDIRSGKTILGGGSLHAGERMGGHMTERVIDISSEGGITKLTTEQIYPLQEAAKTFGIKAIVRQETDVMAAAGREWGGNAGDFSSLTHKIEVVGHASLLKKNPTLIRQQMLGGLLAFGAEKAKTQAGLMANMSIIQRQEAMSGSPLEEIFTGMAWGNSPLTFQRSRILDVVKGFKGEGPLGVESGILRLAREFGLSPAEIGMIGGYFHQVAPTVGEGPYKGVTTQTLEDMYRNVGLGDEQISAIRGATKVVGMPQLNFGDYPTYTEWERGTIEPRGIKEILWQDWKTASGSPAGKTLAAEIESRRIPNQVLGEMETALASLSGNEIPAGLETVPAAEASFRLRAADHKPFIMQLPSQLEAFPSRRIYVPGRAALMDEFTTAAGEKQPQDLLKSYLRLAESTEENLSPDVAFAGARLSQVERMERAGKEVLENTYKQWLLGTHAGGQVIGTAAPVAQSWKGRRFDFSSEEDFIISQTDLGRKGPRVRIGLGRDDITKMYQDLIDFTKDKGERRALRGQRRAMMRGIAQPGLLWRHPLHYPYSAIPVEYEYAKGEKSGVFYPKVYMPHKGGQVDISNAYTMNLDMDSDRAVTMIIGREKSRNAVRGLLHSDEYRRGFVESAQIQYDLEKLSKVSTGKSVVSGNVDYDIDEQIKRMAGIKTATPKVSIAAQKLRLASRNAPVAERGVTSTMLAMLEQSIISSKKGGMSEDLANALSEFTRGAATGEGMPKEEFAKVWQGIWGQDTLTVGSASRPQTLRMQEVYENMSARLRTAQVSGEMGAFETITRGAARAAKGGSPITPDAAEAYRRIETHRAGMGDSTSGLVRAARAPSTGAQMARADMAAGVARIKELGSVARKYWKAPAIGVGIALAARYMLTPPSIQASDNRHEGAINSLIETVSQPTIRLPQPFGNRIVTTGGGSSPSGYDLNITQDIRGSRGTEQIMNLGAGYSGEDNANIRVRDSRGAIQPEHINKMTNDDYQYARPPGPYGDR